MNSTNQPQTTQLRIWQQNLNSSKTAQLSLLEGPKSTQWDILALQEPYIDPRKNTTSTRRFHVVYP
ncbi:hypothetical protein BU15DRAFT_54274, partial [Melanogaster broomeanus]